MIMSNLLLFAFLAFSLTGMLTPSLVSDSFADTENPGRDQGKKTANGCDKGKTQKNPNCGTNGDSDRDGIPDSEDACPTFPPAQTSNGEPDHDGDGVTDSQEIFNGTDPCVIE